MDPGCPHPGSPPQLPVGGLSPSGVTAAQTATYECDVSDVQRASLMPRTWPCRAQVLVVDHTARPGMRLATARASPAGPKDPAHGTLDQVGLHLNYRGERPFSAQSTRARALGFFGYCEDQLPHML